MARKMTIVVPAGLKPGESFQVEVASGVTGEIRAFTRQYVQAHPDASKSDVFRAYYDTHKGVNPNTLTTQISAAW